MRSESADPSLRRRAARGGLIRHGSREPGARPNACYMIGTLSEMRRTMFMEFVRDSSAASTSEYALILAIMGAGLGYGVYRLGIEESAAILRTADNIIAFSGGGPNENPGAPALSGAAPPPAAAKGARGRGKGNSGGSGKGHSPNGSKN